MKMKDFLLEFEVMTGCATKPVLIRFIDHLDVIGQQLEIKGRADAAQGISIPTEDVFRTLSEKLISQDSVELLEAVADLFQLYYLDGYEAYKNSRKVDVPA